MNLERRPTTVVEVKVVALLTFEEAARQLRDIWLEFGRAGDQHQAVGSRRSKIEALDKSLSPEAKRYLDEEVSGEGRGVITRGREIQLQALKEVQGEKARERRRVEAEKETARRQSRGQKRATRNRKAEERRRN